MPEREVQSKEEDQQEEVRKEMQEKYTEELVI